MSDFDKEKERERLREKYEQDKQKREATEKMSELLLQGATMTNAHCSECGDPIFRYDGQEFCATCEKPVDREGSDAEDTEGDDGSEESQGAIEVTSPSDDAQVKFGGQSADSAQSDGEQGPRQRADAGQDPSRETDRTGQTQSRQPQSRESQSPERQPRQPQTRDAQTREIPSIEPGEGGDVTAARESLVRTLQRFSEQAEATEDPQRAREHLAAAREAAETLAALRR